jgi:phosphopantothenoylcysteine decarboxylase/phosphopantothenate--cysteine ligase
VINIQTAKEMFNEVLKYYGDTDIVIKAAAVSDYRPVTYSDKKLKKQQGANIELVKNPDILFELGKLKKHQILVGFAAETNNLEEYALEKLKSKNLDMIVVNQIGQKDSGFANDTNIIQIITNKGEKISYPKLDKRECAINILKKTLEIL